MASLNRSWPTTLMRSSEISHGDKINGQHKKFSMDLDPAIQSLADEVDNLLASQQGRLDAIKARGKKRA